MATDHNPSRGRERPLEETITEETTKPRTKSTFIVPTPSSSFEEQSSSHDELEDVPDWISPVCNPLIDGVYEFCKPVSGSINLEIVFFHGFQRGACDKSYVRTWMTGDGSACWLGTWLAESFPQARILSVSYDSSVQVSASEGRMDMYLIAENLVRSLVEHALVGEDCPVVLVGHCVGGLVLKEICRTASRWATEHGGSESPNIYKQFLKHLRGMFFYDTPHLGSHVPFRDQAKGGGPLLQYLRLLNEKSARINDEFSKLRRLDAYGWATFGLNAANETRTSMVPFADHEFTSAGELSVVVSEGSGRNDMDTFATISGVDHFTICRPWARHSSSFKYLVHFLEEILRKEEERDSELKLRLQLPRNLIQTDGRIKTVIKLLDLDNPKLIRLSLVGMDGIGKSTLAKQLLIRLQHGFHLTCFMEFEEVPQKHQWANLKKLVAENLFRGRGKQVSHDEGASWFLLRRKRVLIIADDIESEDQIQPFLTSDWCGEGSRFIITTSTKGLMSQVDSVEYEVPPLSAWQSLQLFKDHLDTSLQAAVPEKLLSEIIDECDGLPLALKLLASYLCKKKEKMVHFCKDALYRLRTDNALEGKGRNRVWRALKVIFDDLNPLEKRIFLDLATFDSYGPDRKQYDLNVLTTAWSTKGENDHGSSVRMAIENLQDACFLRIIPGSSSSHHVDTDIDDQIEMVRIHKVLRNMGRWLSRPLTEEFDRSPDHEGCRGLWDLEDVQRMLSKVTTENKVLETLSVTMEPYQSSSASRQITDWGSMSRLVALRLLRMSNINLTKASVEFLLPQSLTMLHMMDCLGPRQVTWLNLSSWWKVEYWPIREENVELLGQLSVLLLYNCGPVRLPPNFHQLKSLRILHIHDKDINSIVELPQKFGHLPALKELDLSAPVKELPDSLLLLASVRKMRLNCCLVLRAWPVAKGVNATGQLASLQKLELINLPLVRLPNSFGGMASLETLSLKRCSSLEALPEGFGGLQRLKSLLIHRCEKLERLCETFDSLRELEELRLFRLNALRMLPHNFGLLPSLQDLDIEYCSTLAKLPQSLIDIKSLSNLRIIGCDDLVSLREDLGHCGFSCQQKRLRTLTLRSCSNLQSLPECLVHSTELQLIDVNRCGKLQDFPGSMTQLPSLTSLKIENCEDVVQLPEFTSQLSSLTALCLSDLPNLVCLPESVGELKSLRKLDIVRCTKLLSLPMSLGLVAFLRELTLEGCGNILDVPESLGDLMNLTHLRLEFCEDLQTLPRSLGQLPSLRTLKLRHCASFHAMPDSLCQSPSLRVLKIQHCGRFRAFPDTFSPLSSLSCLYLEECEALITLPESSGRLSSLEMLYIRKCKNFMKLPDSIGQLPTLTNLTVRGCGRFAQVPKAVANLQSLDCLNLKNCGAFETLPLSAEQNENIRRLALPSFKDPGSLLRELQQFNGKALWSLRLDVSGGTVSKDILEHIQKLPRIESLGICNCATLESVFESLQHCMSLQTLKIFHSEHLKEIPETMGKLSQVRRISIKGCWNMEGLPKSLGQVASLDRLDIVDCGSLKIIPDSTGQLKSLRDLRITNCDSIDGQPDSLGELSSLMYLSIQNCSGLKKLPESLGQLHVLLELSLTGCEHLKTLPESTGQLLDQSLESLNITNCDNFEQLPKSLDVDDPRIRVLNCRRFNCRTERKSVEVSQNLRK